MKPFRTSAYTPQQRENIIKTVKAADNKAQALKDLKVPYATYYGWVNPERKKAKAAKRAYNKKTPELLEIPYSEPGPLVILIGKPRDVYAALERVAAIQR